MSAGVPAAFLRLGNCNLACHYCDTPYTWDESRYDLSAELVPTDLDEVAGWIEEKAPGRLIVTGGEPLLQHRLLLTLLNEVDQRRTMAGRPDLFVEVETNGTIGPSTALMARINQWNVSPKLACSNEVEGRRIKPEVLRRFADCERAFFKFVVEIERDVDEVRQLMSRFRLDENRVLLMPQAIDADRLRQRSPEVARWALRENVRFSSRVHLELYGGKRGT